MSLPPRPRQFEAWEMRSDFSPGLFDLRSLMENARSEVEHFHSTIVLADVGFHHTADVLNKMRSQSDDDSLRDALSIYSNWTHIAADAAISTLFHFKDILTALSDWCEKDAFHHRLRNPNAVTEACAVFERHFPKWKQMRDATAHAAEIRTNPDKNWHAAPLSKGIVRKPKGSTALISDCFEGRTFVTTRKGELLRFPVTWERYGHLLEVYEILRAGLSLAPSPHGRNQTSRPPSSDGEDQTLP